MKMIARRFPFLLAGFIFLLACILLYTSLDASNTKRKDDYSRGKGEVEQLEKKLHQLESELQRNELLIGEIRNNIYKMVGGRETADTRSAPGDTLTVPTVQIAKPGINALITGNEYSAGQCESLNDSPATDLQMLDVYQLLNFDNPDGGSWKQGWDIVYDRQQVESNQPQLQVYLVPHSHDDPGWLKTFEKYYQDQTRKILDNMVIKLASEPKMKFIYAEVSFFERWWTDADDAKRQTVKKLLESGQLEFVTGGWVMTDEANAHYFSMIDQLVEGHQWLMNTLSYRPRHHWSIDPFGLSATMPYLLKLANFSTMTIQRVHYAVKKHLAQTKQLEFMWRPLWAKDSNADIFCHMMPFFSYDIPHTCGPDPKICCQFDFRRLPSSSISCPWNIPPKPITAENVAERAYTLLDQYRKKAQLFKTNVLFIPLGDDFRYDTGLEWNQQFENYQKLFDHMNSQAQWNVHAQFGTLADYFAALYSSVKSVEGSRPPEFPTLSGDFFTYADRDDHYWSGYYTSRPLHKRMDRILQQYLRGAEIIFSFAQSTSARTSSNKFPAKELYPLLVAARRNLALFQHHDGVTGTAKDHVVLDYGERMAQALKGSINVIKYSAHYLLATGKDTFSADFNAPIFMPIDDRPSHEVLPEKEVIQATEQERLIYVYNSLPYERNELICLFSSSFAVEILDTARSPVAVQITPSIYRIGEKLEISASAFEVCFVANVGPFGFQQYRFRKAKKFDDGTKSVLTANFPLKSTDFPPLLLHSEMINLIGADFTAIFSSKSGYLQKIKLNSGNQFTVPLEFVKYGTTSNPDKSGAYLFMPDGPAEALPTSMHHIVVVEGPLFASVIVGFPQMKHVVRVVKVPGIIESQSLLISNFVDVKKEFNYEIAMRFQTDIKNVDSIWFSDLNGFQMIKRKFFGKLPIQGNFYPMPVAAYLEDFNRRFTILSGQPLGVGSLQQGHLEVILDRRLMQDDNRGLGQGLTDNRVTLSTFRLLFEPLNGANPSEKARIGYLSAAAHHSSMVLLHPLFGLYQNQPDSKADLLPSFSPLSGSFPCDVHVVNLRTLSEVDVYGNGGSTAAPKREYAMILHRLGFSCTSKLELPMICNSNAKGQLQLKTLMNGMIESELEETSLTLMNSVKIAFSDSINLDPMEIKTFKFK